MSFSMLTLSDRASRPVDSHTHALPLDGIRGLAILLVATGHFVSSLLVEFAYLPSFLGVFKLGWIGVDLFFVLSGYLITGILYEARGSGAYFRNFYARRALRIFPLYYLALVVVLVLSALLRRLGIWGSEHQAWMWVYLTNAILAMREGSSFGILDHFWSLAVEEHFYLVWPAIVFTLGRRGLMVVAGCAMAVAFALRLMQVLPDGSLANAAYVFTPMRMDGLAAGAFLALLVRGPKGMAPLVKPAVSVAVLTGLGFLIVLALRRATRPDDVVIGTLGLTLLWSFFTAFLLLALAWKPLDRLMSLPVLRWFGKYSYGMYVWHPIVFMLVFHNSLARDVRGGDSPLHALLTGGVALVVMFGVTLASWHCWEKPFLSLKRFFVAEPAVPNAQDTPARWPLLPGSVRS